MKFKTIIFIGLFFVAEAFGDPLLAVVLMVKNEASVITQTLQPLVDGGLKDFVVFDTGSTDGTQEIAREFFKQHDMVNAHIVEDPFVDFATSRNRALDAAQRIFPQATFMLMPDAEWYMRNVEGLVQFCKEHKDDCHASYFISMRLNTLAYSVDRLIRCGAGIRFVGPVHETLNQLTTAAVPQDISFDWQQTKKGIEKSTKRWQRDRDLLLKSYEQNPFDARTLFYLGQTYECLGDFESAYIFYHQRGAIQGWDEENFVARYRLGNVAQNLGVQDDQCTIPLAIRHYLEAFALRPQRAEPLIKIAQYYIDKNDMQMAFLFAARAVEIPYPEQDILFVEKDLYDFVRYDLLGRCAWYVGENELGEWAVKQALAVKPHEEYLKRNLKCYTDCMSC